MSDANDPQPLTRRVWGQRVVASLISVSHVTRTAVAFDGKYPAIHLAVPQLTHGVASGDCSGNSAVIWARADRPSRMVVEYATNERFTNSRGVVGPIATPETDLTARTMLTGLPPGQTILYRVGFRDLDNASINGASVAGRFRTVSNERTDIRFVWGGDVAGQGWGIDASRGGMATFEAMGRVSPDFFQHSGDHIYADNAIVAEVPLPDGSSWKNLVTPETSKVAETLDEFRGLYKYNRLDEHFRTFAAEVPLLAQWDDHEVRNNWYPGQKIQDDPRYTIRSVDVLAARGRRAFLENMPMLRVGGEGDPIYRVVNHGPMLDVFLLDQRSYRGPNTENRQTEVSATTAFLGQTQLAWLKKSLQESKAVWKVIASDMPLGLLIGDGPTRFEAVANGNGPALGRELEIADLLTFVK